MVETFDPTREPTPVAPTPAPNVEPPAEPAPKPEPPEEPSDAHFTPLENEDDARWLNPSDPRRKKIEEKRGKKFD